MKIFNWVQKRLHPNLLKDGVARKVKKTDSVAIHSNTKALMEQVAFVDVLDGWKYGGILTIGTFGFDPLTKLELDQEKDYSASESDEEAEEGDGDGYGLNNDNVHHEDDNNSTDAEGEEVNPLMFNMSFEEAGGKTADIEIMSVDDFVVLGAFPPVVSSTHEIKLDHLDDQGKLKRRTTLAELFSEDSDSDLKKKPNPKEFKMNSGTKAFPKTKHGLSFAKKLIPHAGEDSRPLKKIQKMMRRMLKKKIHPDTEGKGSASNFKPGCPNKPVVLGQAAKSVSHLPTPEAAA